MNWHPVKLVMAILGVYLFIVSSIHIAQADDDVSFRNVKSFNFENEEEDVMGSRDEVDQTKKYGRVQSKNQEIGTDEEVYSEDDDGLETIRVNDDDFSKDEARNKSTDESDSAKAKADAKPKKSKDKYADIGDDDILTETTNIEKPARSEKAEKKSAKAGKDKVKAGEEGSPLTIKSNYIDRRIRRDVRVPEVDFDPTKSNIELDPADDSGVAAF